MPAATSSWKCSRHIVLPVNTFAPTKTCQLHNPEDRNLSVTKCAEKYSLFFNCRVLCGLLVTKLTSVVLVGWPNTAGPRRRRGSAFGEEGIGWLVSCLVRWKVWQPNSLDSLPNCSFSKYTYQNTPQKYTYQNTSLGKTNIYWCRINYSKGCPPEKIVRKNTVIDQFLGELSLFGVEIWLHPGIAPVQWYKRHSQKAMD